MNYPSTTPNAEPDRVSRRFSIISWPGLRRLSLLTAAVVVLIAFGYGIENWRGWQTWKAEVDRLAAAGISVDFADYVPPPVPEERNFALTPLLRPLLDYTASPSVVWRDTNAYRRTSQLLNLNRPDRRGSPPGTGSWTQGKPVDLVAWQQYLFGPTNSPSTLDEPPAKALLRYLATLTSDFDAMAEAARLPESRFPLHYDEGYLTLLPHLSRLLVMSRTFALRASARLVDGQNDRVFQDLETILRFADAVETEPYQISQTVRQSVFTVALQVFWEGQVCHAWSDAQLAAFTQRVAPVDLVAGFRRALSAERAGAYRAVQGLVHSGKYRSSYASMMTQGFAEADGHSASGLPLAEYLAVAPRGWLYASLAETSQALGQLAAVQPRNLPTLRSTWNPVTAPHSIRSVLHINYFQSVAHGLEGNLIGTFRAQTRLHLGLAAAALERHRLATGAYPSKLEDLPPALRGDLREDLITGQPLLYQTIAADEFMLWSVGEDGRDDRGAIAPQTKGSSQEAGDWVWRWPDVVASR